MGFTFDGVASKDMKIATRMDIENRIPSLRNNTGQIAGRHGVYDFGETFAEREIAITCFIPPGNNDSELLALKDRIVSWLNPDKGLCPLILDSQPGRYYKARLKDTLAFEKLVRNTGTFELTFICPDPFAYAVDDDVFVLTKDTRVNRTQGNLESYPLYELKGQLENSSQNLWFSVNGNTVAIFGPLSRSETAYIDMEDLTAYIVSANGTKRNALSKLERLFFPSLPLGESMIWCGSQDGELISITVHSRSRWL